MSLVALVGDSVFDNAADVPGEPSVAEQLRAGLGPGWQVHLLARDGDRVADVARQLRRLPPATIHLLVSAGGNDALDRLPLLEQAATTVADALGRLAEVGAAFAAGYRQMLGRVAEVGARVAVCTVYDAVPGLRRCGGLRLRVAHRAFAARRGEDRRGGAPLPPGRWRTRRRGDGLSMSPAPPAGGEVRPRHGEPAA